MTKQSAASKPFDLGAYGPVLGPLLDGAPLNELRPGRAMTGMEEKLKAISLKTAFATHAIVDRTMAQACLAGLWLRFDFLDQSHGISQEIHNPSGSFWHGIMHRREPDYDNAKYWFRRVGRHPINSALNRDVQEIVKLGVGPQRFDPTADVFLAQQEWDAFAFVDLVESVASKPSSIEKLCRQIQRREWELLFDFCYRAAIGKTDHD